MFWKKKANDPISVELNDDQLRADVRIQPMDPLLILVQAQQWPVLDISVSGLSFKSNTMNSGDSLAISLQLPQLARANAGEVTVISGTIKILHINGQICHCQFIELKTEARQHLEQFILAEQKRQIRANR